MILEYKKTIQSALENSDYCQVIPNYYEETDELHFKQLANQFIYNYTHDKIPIRNKMFLNKVKRKGHIKTKHPKDNEYYITFPNVFNLPPLHFFLSITKSNLKKLPKEDQWLKELLTFERGGNCHDYVIDFCSQLPNSKIVTALTYDHAGTDAIIHSYIVIDEITVFDPTKNLLMRKEDYEYFFGVVPLKEISHTQLTEDIKILNNDTWIAKIYCLFPDEYVNDLKQEKRYQKKKSY